MKLYGDHRSGNCYKVLLTAALLGIELTWVDIDIMSGGTQTAAFLRLNPLGKIPLLQVDNQTRLSESNAIVNYLAYQSALIPQSRLHWAQVQQWQFFEQYSHEPYIAVARFIQLYLGLPVSRMQEYKEKQAGGHKALAVMEQHLQQNEFLVNQQLSVADVSLFAYTHVADEGGFDLSPYPAILAWLDRIRALPQFVAMTK
ncbi:glutathione S-transferase family protein [Marinicella litoralis]|uniref:Glutathione S-transferase n=1 Tax=Marinicella litoralis TaxID=644220 RepID=A0A4R6XUY5_9GAMM|nr:glutathione S-transferase family protein [Marinicella litoralis]TDR23656.1 glutathione S-transferase [Marinicella litoralis]